MALESIPKRIPLVSGVIVTTQNVRVSIFESIEKYFRKTNFLERGVDRINTTSTEIDAFGVPAPVI